MSCNPLRWWWGLLPVAVLIWLAFIWEKEPIQNDLRLRAETALSSAGITWVGTAFDGRDALLKGIAFKEEQPGQAADLVRRVWGVRVVEEKVDLIAFVENYEWSAEKVGNRIVLSGHVPNEEARTNVLKLVKSRFADFTIQDRMELARGAPPQPVWLGGIGFALDRLSQLKSGSLKLTGLDLSLVGEARDFSAFKSAKAALASAVPEGIAVVNNNIRPPIVSPFTWSASRTATHLILSGHVPGDELRERVFGLAKKEHPKVVIIDRMETGAGAPDGWESVAATIISQLARLESGKSDLSDTELTLTGKAPDEDTANAVETEISDAIPKEYRFVADITFPEPKPPLVSPYTTGIDASGDVVRLTGFVPSDDARTALIEAARKAFKDKRIVDQIALGSGQPEGWRRCVLAGLEATSKLGSGTVLVIDKSLKVTATTTDEAMAEALPGEVRAATTRACESDVVLSLDLPSEPDLTWRSLHDGKNTVVLEGEVPNIETLTLLLATARKQFPKADIENRMTIAGGYAAKWQKVASHGITLLSLLRRGEATLIGQELVITGEAADTAAATAVKDRLTHNLPKNYAGRDVIEVKSDAMIWAEDEAKRKAEEAAAARRKAREEAEARSKAEEEAKDRRKEDEESNARGKTDEQAMPRSNKDEESRASGKADEEAKPRSKEDEESRAHGKSDEKATARRKNIENAKVHEAAQRTELLLPERHRISTSAIDCQERLNEAARRGAILFAYASADLSHKSRPALDELATIAKSCPGVQLSVEGHTDSIGQRSDNLDLSLRRSQAVIDYLTNAGVPRKRLRPIGHGEELPLAPNNSSANRALNRRIEFTVDTGS